VGNDFSWVMNGETVEKIGKEKFTGEIENTNKISV